MPIFWDVTRRTPWSTCCTVAPQSLTCWSGCLVSPWSLFDKPESASLLIPCPRRHHLANICSLPNSLYHFRFPLQGFMKLIPSIAMIGSPEFRGLLATFAPHPNIRKLREIAYFLYDTNKAIHQQRVRAITQAEINGACEGKSRDIISVFSKQNEGADRMDKLSDDELISQMGTLIFAGHDTTSVSLCHILHILSLHPEIQTRLRLELMDARVERRDISYDDLTKLPYLEAVCKETLRLYAPITQLHRVSRKSTIIPLSRPVLGRDGQIIDYIPVRAVTMMFVGAAAVNRDPAICGPDADQWIPERWFKPLPESIIDAYLSGAYSHMMTFIGGGRSCIGFKFAKAEPPAAQSEAVLYVLLSRMKFGLSDTPILWNMYNSASPAVQGGNKPSMSLKVTLLSK